jgi:hypothetical protein
VLYNEPVIVLRTLHYLIGSVLSNSFKASHKHAIDTLIDLTDPEGLVHQAMLVEIKRFIVSLPCVRMSGSNSGVAPTM